MYMQSQNEDQGPEGAVQLAVDVLGIFLSL